MTSQPTFTILSMVYADRNITSYAKRNAARGSQLVIDTNNIVAIAYVPRAQDTVKNKKGARPRARTCWCRGYLYIAIMWRVNRILDESS
jgi:hypothetical protein